MRDFRDWFFATYEAALPISIDAALVEVSPNVWMSDTARVRVEHPPMIPEFLEEAGDYLITGTWGRGVNSYAFYLVEQRGPHRRFFRLFSGGVYARPEDTKRAVVEFLKRYESWRAKTEPQLQSSTLVDNMGDCTAELVFTDGRTVSIDADEDDLFQDLERGAG